MKKNKKGFTLVEILAVIVVLIIISIIAINKVSQVMRTNNENATKANAVTFIKVIEDNTSLNRLTGNFNDGSYTVAQLLDMGLKVNGTKPSDGSVFISDGKVLFACLEYEKFTFQGNKNNSEITKDKCNDLGTLNEEYAYTGSEQVFKALLDGTYKLEVWGAQGGSVDSTYIGGYGGYSVAYIKLKKGEKLFVNVGGEGTKISKGESTTGGYNGGGNISLCQWTSATSTEYCGSGGGATSITTKSGLLSSFANERDKVLIVAGGGGGAEYTDWTSYYHIFGGSGGGYSGGRYTSTTNHSASISSYVAASQTAAGSIKYANDDVYTGSFGQGSNSPQSGGGGGYYGGAGTHGGSGGGTGYIGNYKLLNRKMYCYNCSAINIPSMETDSVACAEETPTEKCAKKGNGFAKITYTTEDYSNDYKYLYSSGNEFTDVTGGWAVGADQSNGRAEKLKDSLYIYTTRSGTSESHANTVNAVDITGYTKLHVIYQIVSTYTTGDYGKLQVVTGSNSVWVQNVGEGIYHGVVNLPSTSTSTIRFRDWDVNIKILQVYLSKD